MRFRGLWPLLLAAAAPPAAAEPFLALPIDCELGESCYIQSYTDLDPSEAAADYTCGTLSYDGHKGTDFALPSLAAMEAGVDVLAAAPGIVRATRDGMADRLFDPENGDALDGRDCGNGLVIRHSDGWETQYCHMRRGSIAVEAGEQVAAGTLLGQVGLSGRTEFPHLHLSVRHEGRVVDPFAPDAAPGRCGQDAPETLWRDPPPYRPGGLITSGFADAIPAYESIKAGTAHDPTMRTTTPALVLWGFGYGSRAGDVMEITITDPDGATVFASEAALDRPLAQFFRAAGRRISTALSPGTYTGRVTLRREGELIDETTTQVMIR